MNKVIKGSRSWSRILAVQAIYQMTMNRDVKEQKVITDLLNSKEIKNVADKSFFSQLVKKTQSEKKNIRKEIVKLITEILEPINGIVFDPTCGSGGMFVQSEKWEHVHKNNQQGSSLSIYGVESQNGIWRICKMNLAVRGIDSKNIIQTNSLIQDPFPNLKANRILANPPFNQGEWGLNLLQAHKMFRKYG